MDDIENESECPEPEPRPWNYGREGWGDGRHRNYMHKWFFGDLTFGSLMPEAEGARPSIPPWIEVSAEDIWCNAKRVAGGHQWAYALAHGLLHLGLGHAHDSVSKDPRAWVAACCVVVTRLLPELSPWPPLPDLVFNVEEVSQSEDRLYAYFLEHGVPDDAHLCTPRGFEYENTSQSREEWRGRLEGGLAGMTRMSRRAYASYRRGEVRSPKPRNTPAERAIDWLESGAPFMKQLAYCFTVVEDAAICRQLDIRTAAISLSKQKIYVNPAAELSESDARYVVAHQLLHAGLGHGKRRLGRDPELWGIASDIVVDTWLHGWFIETGIMEMPRAGSLYDSAYIGWSADAIYRHLAGDPARRRGLQTMRGHGCCDVLGSRLRIYSKRSWQHREGPRWA